MNRVITLLREAKGKYFLSETMQIKTLKITASLMFILSGLRMGR